MADPFFGEIRIVSFAFAPKGWALCNGQLMPINQNQALYSILGTNYGGNGVTTFALPNLQGRFPLHVGNQYSVGQAGGEEAHVLTVAEIPAHAHQAQGAQTGRSVSPANAVPAIGRAPLYNTTPNAPMNANALSNVGSGTPHENRPPYLALNFVISLAGIFPSRP